MMPSSDLTAITARYRAALTAVDQSKQQVRSAQAELKQVRRELAEAVVAQAKQGTRQYEIVAVTGLSRERIRQILRAAGVTADDE
jgi:N-acetylglutamate synthase/N-acetylornithine aminotransferase